MFTLEEKKSEFDIKVIAKKYIFKITNTDLVIHSNFLNGFFKQ